MIVFYVVNAVTPLAFLDMEATPFGIAAVHSVFNILSTVFLLPFSGGLVRLACLSVREEDFPKETHPEGEESVLHLLDVRFLEVPSYAVERSRTVAGIMAELAEKSMNQAMGLLQSYTEDAADEVAVLECRVDALEDELGSYLMKLSTRDMPERDSHLLSTMLHCISDFERISDYARNIKEAAEEMTEKGLQFSEKALDELAVLSTAIRDILNLATRSFREGNLQLARQVEPLEEVIDGLNLDIRRRHVKRLRKGKCTIELGFLLYDIVMHLKRASEHCTNIAVCMLQVSDEEFDTHAYLERLKQDEDIEFRGKVLAYGERYKLP